MARDRGVGFLFTLKTDIFFLFLKKKDNRNCGCPFQALTSTYPTLHVDPRASIG
jgi:hypothetical protein